jgi:hypothetical protein
MLSAVGLLIKGACFVTKENIITVKMSRSKLVSTTRSTVPSVIFLLLKLLSMTFRCPGVKVIKHFFFVAGERAKLAIVLVLGKPF